MLYFEQGSANAAVLVFLEHDMDFIKNLEFLQVVDTLRKLPDAKAIGDLQGALVSVRAV